MDGNVLSTSVTDILTGTTTLTLKEGARNGTTSAGAVTMRDRSYGGVDEEADAAEQELRNVQSPTFRQNRCNILTI